MLWLESFGCSHGDVYCHVVTIDLTQTKFHRIHIINDNCYQCYRNDTDHLFGDGPYISPI